MTGLILVAFGPVFAMIATGYGVRVAGWLPHSVWPGVNALNYRLLLPCFLFTVMARSEFAAPGLVELAGVSALASLLTTGLAWAACLGARLDARTSAPLIATAALWNMVMFMALSERLLGPSAFDLSAAILGPGALVGTAATVAAFALSGPKHRIDLIALKRLIQDPLVIGVLAGLAVNFTGLSRFNLITDTIALMGAGATAAILIAMGAGLEFEKLKGRLSVIALSSTLRALAAPALFLGLGIAFGLPGQHVVLLTLAGGAPGAAIIYAIGSELDGDTPLTAGLLTASVLGCALTLPAFTALALTLVEA